MARLLRVGGLGLSLGAGLWLLAQLLTPRSLSGAEVAAIAVLLGLGGLALFWLGGKRDGRGRRTALTLLNGYRGTALLCVATKLGLADLLASGPRSSAELAQTLGAHAPSLHRILRGLVAVGLCFEAPDGRFGLTSAGRWLRTDIPGTLRDQALLAGEEYVGAWGSLLHTVLTGETAFDHAFGMSQWEHRRQHPELGEGFGVGLARGTTEAVDAILAAYDFAPFATIADVGGGHGALVAAILRAHPAARGILVDQPDVVAAAQPDLEAAGVAARCEVVGGSFFEHVPEGADLCILKSVIHDWDDERSLALLRNCHRALPADGTLLLIERIMPVRVDRDPHAVLLDVHMLALTGGRERTEEEYRALLTAAGFTPRRVILTTSGFSLIEARPVELSRA